MLQAGSIGGWDVFPTRRRVARQRATGLVPGFEVLEGRVVPSTFTVTNTNDSGPGSLRAVLSIADQDPGRDTITFAPGVTGTITLLSALPDLATDIVLSGPSASALTVARSSDPAAPLFRIFNVTAGAEVAISGLTVAGGRVFDQGGGGIANAGTLTVTSSTLSGNAAAGGGGIYNNFGTVTVIDSTLSGNSVGRGPGGGISNNFGTLTIIDSTLSGNSAGFGGCIYNYSGTVTVTDSTLSGNSAGDGDGGIVNLLGTVTATTSIFANSHGGNISGLFISGGHNLFSDAPAVALDSTDLINTDPMLGPLADNGGPTQTMALLPGSPAIDAGLAVPGVNADQRGVPRSQGAAPDIGAFEVATTPFVRLTPATATRLVGASHSVTATLLDPDLRPLAGVPVTFQVTAGPNAGVTGLVTPAGGLSDANGRVGFRYTGTGGGTDVIVATAMLPGGPAIASLAATVIWTTFTVTNTNDSGPGSLRAALSIADQDPGRDTITFAPGVTGTITLLSALPDLATDIVLSGPGALALTVGRNSSPSTPLFRIFNVTVGAEVAISGLTVAGGLVVLKDGGGIANAGTLTVTSSTISGNSAAFAGSSLFVTASGGGILNSGTLMVINSTISGNSAGRGSGGGILNFGTVTVIDSALSGNSAEFDGGGIANAGKLTIINSAISGNSASGGGGITNDGTGTVTITDSIISGNSVGGFGGGGVGGGIANFSGTVTVTNSTLGGNSAGFGGGICNVGKLTITGSTLSGNSAGFGGGIYNDSGMVTVTTSLFANPQGGNLAQADSASFVSGGHNLFSDAPAVALDTTDLINTDPMLGPLADNGGPTQTMALLPGSPAIDAGLAVPGVNADQRGVPRSQGAAPDIGAFESRGFSLAIVSGNNQSAPGGSPFPSPLVVRVASPFGEPVAGGRVTFAAPTAGASASFAADSAPIDARGLASVLATANGLGGPYAVTAQTAGAVATLAFALENLVTPPPENPMIPPRVLNLQRYGVHAQPTTLVLHFSAAMDRARAQDVVNYRIVTLGGHGRGGSRIGHVTRVRRAVYDPMTGSVTLHPARRLDLRNAYRFTVRGTAPGGLAGPTGMLLDGAGTGQPGTDFVTTITRGTLAGSSRASFNQIRYRWRYLHEKITRNHR